MPLKWEVTFCNILVKQCQLKPSIIGKREDIICVSFEYMLSTSEI